MIQSEKTPTLILMTEYSSRCYANLHHNCLQSDQLEFSYAQSLLPNMEACTAIAVLFTCSVCAVYCL